MNILIPHTWLLEHLETSATPEEIQKYLSLSGPSVERIYDIEDEKVYDIEITTNRVDCMSVRGVAREAAVILTQAGFPSQLKARKNTSITVGTDTVTLPLPQVHSDAALCKRVLCVAIADVQKKASPEWMQKRLRLVGINSHDAIIDTSNYVTHDLGHPCHTFDYDKVMATGGEIFIREAQKGKKFSIIDGTEFETVGGEVVFENKEGVIIDLPAIKGTQNTAIDDNTKNVLFWIESLDPKKVRFASMTHAIRTVAAQLNEKNVDPHLGKEVLEAGTALLCEFAGGHVASTVYDEFSGNSSIKPVYFQLGEIDRYLGIHIDTATVIHILETLECIVNQDGEQLKVTPPTFRPDLEIGADIVEEIARIYGYHNLPSTLMTGAVPTNRVSDVEFKLEWDTKQLLAALGAYEVYTYSMISELQSTIERAYLGSAGSSHIALKNPLTDDLVHLRRTLWASHIDVIDKNHRNDKPVIFEFANVYIPSEFATADQKQARMKSSSRDAASTTLPFEEYHLTLTTTSSERTVKGMIEALTKKYHLPTLRYIQTEQSHTVSILAGDTQIGVFIPSQPLLSLRYTATTRTYPSAPCVIDIEWKKFLSLVRPYPNYIPESKFTPITEDLTFTVPHDQQIGRIMETMQQANSAVHSVKLKDLYKQNATFSLSYEANKQLTAEDATSIRTQLVTTVRTQHNATLVGTI